MSEYKNDIDESTVVEEAIVEVACDEQLDVASNETQEQEQEQEETSIDSEAPIAEASFIPAIEYQHNDLYQKIPTADDPQPIFTDADTCSTPTFQDVPLMDTDAQTVIPVQYGKLDEERGDEEASPIAFNGFAVTAILMLPVVAILSSIFPEHLVIISFALSIIAALFSSISAYNDNVENGKPSVLTTIALICTALVICVMVTGIFAQFVITMSAASIFPLLLLSMI